MVAIMSDVRILKTRIGDRLFSGIQASRMRMGEHNSELTRTVALYLARDTGEDFILEAWVSSSHGRAFAEDISRMTSVEDWEAILGSYIYVAMMTSKSRKIEEDAGSLRTRAVRLCSPNGDGYDSKVVVRISFEVGRRLWQEGYR
jgi:hypothetical protein